MGSKPVGYDDQAAAKLVLQLKAIATKEVATIPPNCIDSLFQYVITESSRSADVRHRTVSVGSMEMVHSSTVTPVLSSTPKALVESKLFLLEDDEGSNSSSIDHHDWSDLLVYSSTAVKKTISQSEHPLLTSSIEIIKNCKKKRESFVGLTTKSGAIRATLRKKFSWKSFPELEDYLLQNQHEYFQFSSRNYTPEQRKYNNGLTRGLLELAAKEGYIFEDFTFSMVRDRIRCYYKSHSQSAKKKRKR
ncbi:hypothetical protein IV203_029803 [Nitzschia inconspicua]|uniref:Uncharacterized protein n=1 Tax=Nitzschia inconspicua TaxID=303405 RepID=A0A9K3LRF6_9STRA|nr:hypothetical protein IV203_029803 [Nitzschia inconspicua]